MKNSISITDARKLALHCQGLNSRKSFGSGANGTLAAVRHLGYVQLDTLSVVSRAHVHTLWNRVGNFKPEHLDSLQEQGRVFEYWSHALSVLPIEDYRFCLPMMNRIASGEVHWYPKQPKETEKVLRRIREEGPLSAKDFTDRKSSNAMWARSPSKLALEQLFMEGELMIPRRNNFHKVYDLRERVLPSEIDTSFPDREALCRFLISSYLRAHGLGQVKETGYLRKGLGTDLKRVAQQMEDEELVTTVWVNDKPYLIRSDTLALLDSRLPRSSLRVLSPFDNAVIQRQRTNELFKFDYQIECYVPKAKRKHGYFCLPVLFRNRLMARLDAKADRKRGVFHLLHFILEPECSSQVSLYKALLPELKKFARFNSCHEFKLHKLSGCSQQAKKELVSLLKETF